MKLSKSNRIAIVFSFFTLLVSLFFVAVFNFFSFKGWYEEEQKEVNEIALGYNMYSQIFSEVLQGIDEDDEELDDFVKKTEINKEYKKIFWDIYQEDDKFYLVKDISGKLFVKYDVSIFMKNQIIQVKLGLFLVVLFTFLAFLLSKLVFTRLILKELYLLSSKLEKLNISKHEYVYSDFYDSDIKAIVNKINILLKKIYENQQDLKYFNSQVSHEFKTPLMVINSELEFLTMSGTDNDSLKKIQLQVDKLNNLLNSFVLLTRIDNTKLELTNVKIPDLLEDILSDLKKIYKNKNIKLDLDLKDCKFETNKELFYILLKNLLDNAFKYTNQGGFIDVKFDCKSFIIKNFVSDEKINLDKIFKMFYRNSNNGSGFGIGLAIVKKIVDTLGYKIKVYSQKNEVIFIIQIK